jgi:hypothetical protein
MKHAIKQGLLPLALLASQAAVADFTNVFYDPCDGCTYPDGGWDRPAGYPAANPSGYTPAQGQYYGGDGASQGGDIVGTEEAFDVLSMTVSQSGTNLVVSVLTRFTETAHDLSLSNIIFGDLMIATGTPGNTWKPYGSTPYDYDTAGTSATNWNYVLDTQTGNLYQGSNAMLMNTNDPGASAFYDGLAFRANQYMQYDGSGGTLAASLGTGTGNGSDAQGTVLPDTIDGSGPSDGTTLTYTIPIAALGISLTTPTEVALRWTMTCANDIVEAAVMVGEAPEPASLSLLLAGLAAWRLPRRRQAARPA